MPFGPSANGSCDMSPGCGSVACRQDESCQRRQQRIHPVNRGLDALDRLVFDRFKRICQTRPGSCRKEGPYMEERGLDLLNLPGHFRVLIVQRRRQCTEHRIQFVHIAASFQSLVRLAHALAAEKARLAMIACACVNLNDPPRLVKVPQPARKSRRYDQALSKKSCSIHSSSLSCGTKQDWDKEETAQQRLCPPPGRVPPPWRRPY